MFDVGRYIFKSISSKHTLTTNECIYDIDFTVLSYYTRKPLLNHDINVFALQHPSIKFLFIFLLLYSIFIPFSFHYFPLSTCFFYSVLFFFRRMQLWVIIGRMAKEKCGGEKRSKNKYNKKKRFYL